MDGYGPVGCVHSGQSWVLTQDDRIRVSRVNQDGPVATGKASSTLLFLDVSERESVPHMVGWSNPYGWPQWTKVASSGHVGLL